MKKYSNPERRQLDCLSNLNGGIVLPAIKELVHDDTKLWKRRAEEKEYSRIRDMLKSGELERDNRLAVVDIDGLLQFIQLDFIPFFYCPTERILEYLEEWE